MPFDQKRINGPEVSFTYQQFVASEELNQPCQKFTKRVDGRSLKDHRKFGKHILIKSFSITDAK